MRTTLLVAALAAVGAFLAGCGTKTPEWVTGAGAVTGWNLPDYFVRVDKSAESYEQVTARVRGELAKMAVNQVNQYVAGCRDDSGGAVAAVIQDALRASLAGLELGLADLVRVRGKYEFKGDRYVLGALSVEEIGSHLAIALGGAYDPGSIAAKLMESKENLYRIRVAPSLQAGVTGVLTKEGFVLDNDRWYLEVVSGTEKTGESSIASLTGSMWTVSMRRSLVVKDRSGSEICRVDGSVGRGVSSSKSQAQSKALSSSGVSYSELASHAGAMKQRVEEMMKDEVAAVIQRPALPAAENVVAAIDRGDAVGAQAMLAEALVTSQDFPQAIVLYLRARSAKEQAEAAEAAEGKELIKTAGGIPILSLRQNLRKLLGKIK